MTRAQNTLCSKVPILECKTDEYGNTTQEDNMFSPGDVVTYIHTIKNNTLRPHRYEVTDELPLNGDSGTVTLVEYTSASGDLAVGNALPLTGVEVEIQPGGMVQFKTELTLKGADEFTCLPVPVTNCMMVVMTATERLPDTWTEEGFCPDSCYAVSPVVFIVDDSTSLDKIMFAPDANGVRGDNDELRLSAFFGGDPCDRALIDDWLDSGGTLASLVRSALVVGETTGDRTPLNNLFGTTVGYLDTDAVAP